jgi:hypothetical protein
MYTHHHGKNHHGIVDGSMRGGHASPRDTFDH